jgi:hypothetical protein
MEVIVRKPLLRRSDLANAVLMAEIVHHFFPRLVELHNYRYEQHLSA